MRVPRLPLPLLALALAASPAFAQGALWVVDDDGGAGVDFLQIQPAIDAAASGDTILVRSGVYAETLVVASKGLTLQAQGQPEVVGTPLAAAPTLDVGPLAPTEALAVRGLRFSHDEGTGATVRVASTAGAVLFQDCGFEHDGRTALEIESAASVVLHAASADGGTMLWDTGTTQFDAHPVLRATGADVYLYDTLLLGAIGPDAGAASPLGDNPPGSGGVAIELEAATLFAQGSLVFAGSAGAWQPGACADGVDGADAVVLAGGSLLRRLDTLAFGGSGGPAGDGCPGVDGAAGEAVDVVAGTVVDLPGAARTFNVLGPVAEGTTIDLLLSGEDGDLVFLAFGANPAPGLWFDAYASALHLGLPFWIQPLGAIPPSGDLLVSLPAPLLAPGLDVARLLAQGLFLSGGGAGVFHGGPSLVVLLDASI